jgi:hypothetical protein
LLASHETEIKSAFTLMASIGADYGEPAHKAGRIAGSIQTERGKHYAVAAASTLHQEIAIPLVGQRERKVDAKLLAPNSGAARSRFPLRIPVCMRRSKGGSRDRP